jgi:CheY-like chemotaxis protein
MFDGPPKSVQTILVVEDEILIRLDVADYLRQCGYRVLEASSAADAVTVLQTDHDVDVVFSDAQMPGAMDGFGLARWIRANRPDLKVILTSGVVRSAELAGDLCEDGPIEEKPYHPQRLLEHSKHACAGAPGGRWSRRFHRTKGFLRLGIENGPHADTEV